MIFGKRKRIAELEQQLADLDKHADKLRAERDKLRADLDRKKQRVALLEADNTGLRDRINGLVNRAAEKTVAIERGRGVLMEWRDSDPEFSEIIQEVIDEFDRVTTPPHPMRDHGQYALDRHFGLSRTAWSVLPRVLLNQMPDLWKERFARLMVELDAEFPNLPDIDYTVKARGSRGEFVKLPAALCDYRHPDMEALKQWRK